MGKLPILMYHNISKDDNQSKGLTISAAKLEQQFSFLSKKYETLYFKELNITNNFSDKIIITFDDVTKSQLDLAVPLLKKYNLKATFFVPFKYIGQTDLWNESNKSNPQLIMTIDGIKTLDKNFELGHHSYAHGWYPNMSNESIIEDFEKSFEIIKANGLNVFPVLAYPYGKYPKKNPQKSTFFRILEQFGFQYAVRIGNKINNSNKLNNFELYRIDIKGEDTLFKFKLKLIFGKLKLF